MALMRGLCKALCYCWPGRSYSPYLKTCEVDSPAFPVVQILFTSICSVMTTSVFCRTTLISLPVIASCNVFFVADFFGGETVLLSCVNLRLENSCDVNCFNIFYCLEFGWNLKPSLLVERI